MRSSFPRTAPLLKHRARRPEVSHGDPRTYRENVLTKGKGLKGLRGRWLAQDEADRDTGFAVSLWDNTADMQAYEQSPLYREIMAPLQPFFVGEYKTYRCDVKYSAVGK